MFKQKNLQETQIDFLVSALHHGHKISTQEVLRWIEQKNAEVKSSIVQCPIRELRNWEMRDGRLVHSSGKFFSIDGIRVETNYGLVSSWKQPIINQPEIGFLGFITRKFDGVLHFLLQAKIEPGNLNIVQLSPTLQATRSNYTRVHKGTPPLYLDYFMGGGANTTVLVDQLQSEQGARFLHKRNRNIIIEVSPDEELPSYDHFVWVTLGQIKELLAYPNVVNMDTRTVISCIGYGSYSEQNLRLLSAFQYVDRRKDDITRSYLYSLLNEENHLCQTHELIQWITHLKFKYELNVERTPLEELDDWTYDGNTIRHIAGKYFSVIGMRVEIGNREVVNWDQPMIRSAQEGIIGFLVKRIEGIYHFLVQAKLEAGNFDIVELAPTVQCLTGNYRKGNNTYTVPYIEYFEHPAPEKVWYRAYQSEEGGRFYQEQNLNTIVEVDDDFPLEVPENYCWMTLNQMLSFIRYNNYLNIAARSLLSAIKLY